MDDRFIGNPFFVLELDVGCSSMDIMRQAEKLLGMLELDLEKAKTYATPMGPQPRTVEKVRAAKARLLIPEKRFFDEIWAQARPPEQGIAAAKHDLFDAMWWR